MAINPKTKDANYYFNLPYAIYLKPDKDGSWFAEIPDLPGCMTYGNSKEEVLELIEDAKQTWIEERLHDGLPIPEPTDQ